MTRREFLRSIGLGASLLAAGVQPRVASAGRPKHRPEHRVFADLHDHAMMDEWIRLTPLAQKYPLLTKVVTAAANPSGIDWEVSHAVGIDVLCVPHYNVFDEFMTMPTDPYAHARTNAIRMMTMLEELLNGPAKRYARLMRNHLDLECQLATPKNSSDFRVAVIHALEGGHALGGRIEALDEFARRGVAYITVTHFLDKGLSSAANALPFFPDAGNPPPKRGLSELGRDVILEMERKGILVDVQHMTTTAIEDTLRITTRPLLASHTGARALCDRPYTLPDEHIIEIVRRGGLIGVVLFPFHLSNYGTLKDSAASGSVRDVVRTVRYLVKICGTHEHLGFGSDFGGFITPPKELCRDKSLHVLSEALLEEFSASEVEDIMANNAIRFLRKNWRSGV